MNSWTVQVTISTTRRADAATAAALLTGVSACQEVSCSHGVPGMSVVLGVEATTAAGAYGVGLVILVTEVLPRLEEPILTDVLISTSTQPLSAPEDSALSISATGRSETALA